jgi:predicted RNA-binding protein YlqC (UPF0109 family)
MKKESRKYTRKLLRIEARYQDFEENVLKGTVRNISLGGVYVETSNPLEKNLAIRLSLDAVDLGKVIDVYGKVVRVDEGKGMGIEFQDKENRDIKLLLTTLRKLDQASLLALSRSALGD